MSRPFPSIGKVNKKDAHILPDHAHAESINIVQIDQRTIRIRPKSISKRERWSTCILHQYRKIETSTSMVIPHMANAMKILGYVPDTTSLTTAGIFHRKDGAVWSEQTNFHY